MLLRWLLLWLVDKIRTTYTCIFYYSWEYRKYGVRRPEKGPLELKITKGKTSVLDLGTIGKIRLGQVQVVPGIKRFSRGWVQLVNGQFLDIDSVIFTTGYKSNVPSWLKVSTKISTQSCSC